MMIKITKKTFNLEKEFSKVKSIKNGGYCFFLGTVREDIKNKSTKVDSIFLECYEELALKQLRHLRNQAIKNWKLNDCLIIHRIGKIFLGEKIVLIITASSHREEAMRSCEFIIDNLKVNTAFWKFHISKGIQQAVKYKQKDLKKYMKWSDVVKF